MDIEPSDMCMRDAVEFVDIGQQPTGMGVFCGNQTNPPLVSVSHAISIIFRSDFMVSGKGFRIQYVISAMPSKFPSM